MPPTEPPSQPCSSVSWWLATCGKFSQGLQSRACFCLVADANGATNPVPVHPSHACSGALTPHCPQGPGHEDALSDQTTVRYSRTRGLLSSEVGDIEFTTKLCLFLPLDTPYFLVFCFSVLPGERKTEASTFETKGLGGQSVSGGDLEKHSKQE